MPRHKDFIIENFNAPITCKHCGAKIKSQSAFGTHLKTKHNSTIQKYVETFFEDLDPSFEIETCGFCSRPAKPTYIINYDKSTYRREYQNGYFCFTDECREAICEKFFGKSYSETKSKYEHIGAKAEYLSLRYKKPLNEVNTTLKTPKDRGPVLEQHKCSLAGFKLRYGEVLGLKLYEDRAKRIGEANTLNWYINKYGLELGKQKFDLRQEKMRKAFLSSSKRISKPSHDLYLELKTRFSDIVEEQTIEQYSIDMFIQSLGVAIEFFGDFWHANPLLYKEEFWNRLVHKTAADIRKRDIERINTILMKSPNISKFFVIWESTFRKTDVKDLVDLIQTKIEHSTEKILWI